MKTTISYEEEIARAKRAQRNGILLCIVIILGVMVLPNLSLFRSQADSAIRFGTDGLSVTLPDSTSLSLKYTDITDLQWLPNPDYGHCLTGGTENGCRYGTWKSEAYGTYLLNTNLDFPQAILVRTAETTLLFNFESADTTRQLYESICDVIK